MSQTMDHYVYTIPSQGSGQESKITQIASLEIKMHFIRSSSLFPQNMHTLFFSQDRSRKQTDEPWVKLYSKLFLLNCIQGLPASASHGTAQGSNDCIALKETITNNGCNSGMDEKWNFIITAFKGISISTDCCLFLKKKKTEQIQRLWESHHMISYSLVFFSYKNSARILLLIFWQCYHAA